MDIRGDEEVRELEGQCLRAVETERESNVSLSAIGEYRNFVY